jgi:hypothetical protein
LQINLNMDDLTLGELEELESTVGLPISKMGDGSAKSIVALIWITERRDNPDFTLEDARKIRIGDVQFGNPPQTEE